VRAVQALTVAPAPAPRAARTADPRFDDLSGAYDAGIFRKAYSWLGEVKDNEIAALKAELAGGGSGGGAPTKAARKAARSMEPERREGLQTLLSQLRQQRTEERVAEGVRATLAQRKAEERARVAGGKLPYFPKRRELRELAAGERFKVLEGRGEGAVAKALLKRRKKLAGKERKGGATAGGGSGVYAPFSARRGVDAAEGR